MYHTTKNKAVTLLAILIATILIIPSSALITAHAATLTGCSFSQSTDIVNSFGYYVIRFTTATASTLTSVVIAFPAGFTVSGALFQEETGLPKGSISVSGTSITYSFSATSVGAGKKVLMMFDNIVNPATPSTSYMGTVQTKNGATLVDSCTSASFKIRQLTGADISSSSSLTVAALTTGTLTATSLSLSGAISGATTIDGITLPGGGGTFITTANLASNAVTSLAATGPGLSVSGSKGAVTVSMSTTPSGFTSIGVGSITLSGALISAPSSTFLELSSGGGILLVGDSTSFPLVIFNSVSTLMAFWNSAGTLVNEGNIVDVGSLSAASGLFNVNTAGVITTQSVNFGSFLPGALLTFNVDCGAVTSCSDTFTAPRGEDVIVMVEFDLAPTCTTCGGADAETSLSTTFSGTTIFGNTFSGISFVFIPVGFSQGYSQDYYVRSIPSGTSGTITFNFPFLPSNVVVDDVQMEFVFLPQ